MRRLLTGAALAVLVSSTAGADVFRVGDLGEMPSRRICMSIAAEVLESYIKEYGGLSTGGETDNLESWEFYAWDLRPGEIDVVITCPVVANQVNAFYTLHSSGAEEAENADTAVQRIRELWERIY